MKWFYRPYKSRSIQVLIYYTGLNQVYIYHTYLNNDEEIRFNPEYLNF